MMTTTTTMERTETGVMTRMTRIFWTVMIEMMMTDPTRLALDPMHLHSETGASSA